MARKHVAKKAKGDGKRKFHVNCWCTVARQYAVRAEDEDEAKGVAWGMFENDDLNKAVLGDYGSDIVWDEADVDLKETEGHGKTQENKGGTC